MPNGSVNACANCHISSGGGGARNPFGEAVRALVTSGGQEQFWSAALAAEDSDGDGVSNGIELQDPDGTWQSGDPAPGDRSLVSNPGDPDDFIEQEPEITSPADAWVTALSGKTVVPAVESQARGTAIVQLHEPEMKLFYFLNVFDLENFTAAHVHLGNVGNNGPVEYDLGQLVDGALTGEIDMLAEDIDFLKAGIWYIQVHTTQNPAGELRGQLEDKPIEFKASLNSDQVIADPPVSSNGTGSLEFTLNDDMTKIAFTLTLTDVNNVTAAHLHFGNVGENGGVAITLSSEPFENELSGEADVPEDVLDDLLSEGLYVNVHTQQFPAGEIRGQVSFNAPDEQPSMVPYWEHQN
jgi:hypothetical protein